MNSENYIKFFLHGLIIVSLMVPGQAQSHEIKQEEIKIEYHDPLSTENTLYRPTEEVIEAAAANYTKIQQARARANQAARNVSFGRWGCVRFAKAVTGVYGTWGDGGRKLSLNSDGQIGDVVIFRTYIHVGVITDRQGDMITFREWITTRSAAYERTRVANVHSSEFLGYHKF